MKPLLLLLLLSSGIASAQIPNFILNPSFEDYDKCPEDYTGPCNHMKMSTHWNESSFKHCPNSGFELMAWECGVKKLSKYKPSPALWARSGTSNIFIQDFIKYKRQNPVTPKAQDKDFLNGRFKDSLTKGRPYFVSFYVRKYHFHKKKKLSGWKYSSYGTNDMSAWIHRDTSLMGSTVVFKNQIDYQTIKPQINNPKNVFLTDTGAYQEVSGYFFATGGEKWITVGSFKPTYMIDFDTAVYYEKYDFQNNIGYFFDDFTLVEHPYLGEDTCMLPGDSVLLEVPAYMGNPTGGYRWSTGQANTRQIWAKKPGVYWVEMEAGYTTVRDSIVIGSSSDTMQLGLKKIIRFCNAKTGEIKLEQKGGEDYRWNTGESGSTLSVNTPGIYTMNYSLGNGCRYKRIAEVWMPKVWVESPRPLFNGCDSTYDFLDQADNYLYAKGKYRAVQWSVLFDFDDNEEASPLVANTLRNDGTRLDSIRMNSFILSLKSIDNRKNITVLRAHDSGCVATDTFHFYKFKAAQANLGPDYTLCTSDGEIELKACTTMPVGAETKVLWSTGSTDSILKIDQPGTYWVKTKGKFCSGKDSITIGIFDANLADTMLCAGTPLSISTSHLPFNADTNKNAQVQWYKNNRRIDSLIGKKDISILSGGQWTAKFSLKDSSFDPPLYCPEFYDDFQVDRDSILAVLPKDTFACSDLFQLHLQEVFSSIKWSTDDTSASIILKPPFANYSVEVARNGCKASDSIRIEDQRLYFTARNDTFLCEINNLNLWLKSKQEIQVNWQNNTTDNPRIVNRFGTYKYSLNNGFCYENDAIKIIKRSAKPLELDNHIDTSICRDRPFIYSLSDSGQVWLAPYSGKKISIVKPGNYVLKAFNGCQTQEVRILAKWDVCDSLFLYMPNSFSPNADGHNDEIGPVIPIDYSYYLFEIFNSFGQRIFKTNDVFTQWDGTFRGKDAPLDTYYYILKLENNKREFLKSGIINLIR